ncbi:TIGR03757 family integrating conjugative element protein [Pseudomonas oryzihabitans]|uniref:TIGR03757 family integrating conjugative element protein n=1 Tax=Pseudomonas oryzihabitans TaxID=47885 RepID=UPI00164344F2|nr:MULTISPECIES: TIGR03757 family integrating conjugative element protein [Pseudomonas]UUW72323.1 TIGR03757 family integrating conjugative element protein [Pseudomonas psychrotolerans]
MSISPPTFSAGLKARLLGFVLATACVPFATADVLAISDAAHPLINSAGTRVLLLDAPDRLEQKLSEGLPADPHQAVAIMQQRMRSASAQQLGRDLARAHQDVADAWSLGVAKLPAVVVDRQYVVYGQPDVAAAMASIERFRSTGR